MPAIPVPLAVLYRTVTGTLLAAERLIVKTAALPSFTATASLTVTLVATAGVTLKLKFADAFVLPA